MKAIRVRLSRGGVPESEHEVHAVLAGSRGGERSYGDPELRAYWRSSMKPFQALTVVGGGAAERFELGAEELAVLSASHHGTRRHLAVVEGILERIGMAPSALACGPHRPYDEEAADALTRSGEAPTRLHNNCSGKHAGMLALAVHEGWETDGYHLFTHPLQMRIRRELTRWLDSDPETLTWAPDGCAVPTPFLALREMAAAYWRLSSSDDPHVRAVVSAMTEHPHLVSGRAALSARLMEVTAGRLLAKEGAEGVFCIAGLEDGWGAAFKVRDGSTRAVAPAVLALLEETGVLGSAALERLSDLRRPEILNTRGERVGVIEVEIVRARAEAAGTG